MNDNKTILIEASKLNVEGFDGIKRYVFELLKGLEWYDENGRLKIDFYVLLEDEVFRLRSFSETLREIESRYASKAEFSYGEGEDELLSYEHVLLNIKEWLAKHDPLMIYSLLAPMYRKSGIRVFLSALRKKSIDFVVWLQKLKRRRPKKIKEPVSKEDIPSTFDLIHVPLPQDYRPVLGMPKDQKFLLTVHDLTHLTHSKFHTKQNVLNASEGFKFFNKRDTKYVSISTHTENDLSKLLNVDEHMMGVIEQGVDHSRFFPITDESILKENRFKYGLPHSWQICAVPLYPGASKKFG